jgi:hypothetical protein
MGILPRAEILHHLDETAVLNLEDSSTLLPTEGKLGHRFNANQILHSLEAWPEYGQMTVPGVRIAPEWAAVWEEGLRDHVSPIGIRESAGSNAHAHPSTESQTR